MSEDFKGQANNQQPPQQVPQEGGRVIDESNYQISAPRQAGPSAIGRGGDPLFRRIRASKEQLTELLDETTTVQDWIQRETCNKVALSCLENENLREIYYEIKNGFGEYGPLLLMGFKTPQGIEIPRLKLLDNEGNVLQVLTGPMAIDELNKRALAYKEAKNNYEAIDVVESAEATETTDDIDAPIEEYSGNFAVDS